MQFKPITAIIVLFLVVASLSVAGCTVGLPGTSSPTPTSQVKQYADAWHSNIQDKLGPNETLTVWKEKENGSDTVRLQWTVVNSTTSGFYSNGTTTTYSVNVKQFANIDDAKAFYDDTSFGYAPSTTVNATLIKPEDNIYQQVTGKNVTVLNGAWKLDSFALVTMQASFVIQQNEFVVWGTASVMPNGSTSTITSTPTPEAPAVVATPTPTPVPTFVPTPKPCTHVDIVVYRPTFYPCSMCDQRYATLSQYAGAHSPYVTASFVTVDNSTWTDSSARVSATVRETGATMTFNTYASEGQIEAWSNNYLTC